MYLSNDTHFDTVFLAHISLSDIFTFDQLFGLWRVDLVRSAVVVLSPFILFLPAFEGYIDKHVLLENVLTGGEERKKV